MQKIVSFQVLICCENMSQSHLQTGDTFDDDQSYFNNLLFNHVARKKSRIRIWISFPELNICLDDGVLTRIVRKQEDRLTMNTRQSKCVVVFQPNDKQAFEWQQKHLRKTSKLARKKPVVTSRVCYHKTKKTRF